jgi:antitoxin HigA-1
MAIATPVKLQRLGLAIDHWRAITADTALRLGQWFGTGPELWLNL